MEQLCLSGMTIYEPLEKLLTKFGISAQSEGKDWVQWATYDGYQTPAEKAGNYNTLELEDVLITVAQNSQLQGKGVDTLRRALESEWLEKVEDRLALLLPEDDIADADIDKLMHVQKLLELLDEVKYVGPAIAGKTLARKRPGIIPMTDNVVSDLVFHLSYQPPLLSRLETIPRSSWMKRVLFTFRELCRDHREEIGKLVDGFSAHLPPEHVEICRPRPLRIVEALLWNECYEDPQALEKASADELKNRRNTGWRWDGKRWYWPQKAEA